MQEAQVTLLLHSLHSVAWLIVYANCVLSKSLETLAAADLMTKSDFSLRARVHQFLGEIVSVMYLNYWLHYQETTDRTVTNVGEGMPFLFEFMANTA
jgi:hypothetical protein